MIHGVVGGDEERWEVMRVRDGDDVLIDDG